jgi:hypothetical protein
MTASGVLSPRRAVPITTRLTSVSPSAVLDAPQMWKSYTVRAATMSPCAVARRVPSRRVSGRASRQRQSRPSTPNPTRCRPLVRIQYTRNQRIQQLSPFEVDVLGPLFRNVGEKIKHKLEVRRVAAAATPCYRRRWNRRLPSPHCESNCTAENGWLRRGRRGAPTAYHAWAASLPSYPLSPAWMPLLPAATALAGDSGEGPVGCYCDAWTAAGAAVRWFMGCWVDDCALRCWRIVARTLGRTSWQLRGGLCCGGAPRQSVARADGARSGVSGAACVQ